MVFVFVFVLVFVFVFVNYSLAITHIVPPFARRGQQLFDGLLVVVAERADTEVDEFKAVVESHKRRRKRNYASHPEYKFLKINEVAHCVGQVEDGVAAQVEATQLRQVTQLRRDDADAVALQVQLLEVGERADFGRYAVDEVAAEVEHTQVAHFEDFGRYLLQALEVKLQNIDRIGTAHFLERLVDAVALGGGTKGQSQKQD